MWALLQGKWSVADHATAWAVPSGWLSILHADPNTHLVTDDDRGGATGSIPEVCE